MNITLVFLLVFLLQKLYLNEYWGQNQQRCLTEESKKLNILKLYLHNKAI